MTYPPPVADGQWQRSPGRQELTAQWQLLLRQAASRHSKIMAMAFRLIHPVASAPASAGLRLQTFLECFAGHLRGKCLDPACLAATSPGSFAQPPSHLVLVLMDGHRTQSDIGHLRAARTIWGAVLGQGNADQLVRPCLPPGGSNGMKLRRDQPDWPGQLEGCFRWGSSLIGSHTEQTPGALP